jgi:hypothetical protein
VVSWLHSLLPKRGGVARPRRTWKKVKRQWGLSDLLDSLDAEHKRWELKYHKYSWIEKRDWKALRILGPHVMPKDAEFFPNPGRADLFDIPDSWLDEPLPNVMHVGWRNIHMDSIKEKDEDEAWGTSVWAMRIKATIRQTWRLEDTPGVLYLAGAIIEGDLAQEHGKELAVCSYITVDVATKKIYVPKVLQDHNVELPNGGMYCRRTWGVNKTYGRDVYNRHPEKFEDLQDAAERLMVTEFRACMEAWSQRKNYYQVSTRKGKGRVTFCVGKGEQKFFFKDRDKTAIAADGKRKRIVHYVGEFIRSNGQHVKEHLRGIRQFHWRGYDIAIMVPKFHITTYNFDVEPENEESMIIGQKYVDMNYAVKDLNDLE